MSGVLMPSPRFTGLDSDGNPLVGGLLYSYALGTTTPQPTYTNSDLLTPNSNPVVLDGAGRAAVYLDSALGYKFILKDASGTTIYTQDNVFLAQSAGLNGTSLTVSGASALTTLSVSGATSLDGPVTIGGVAIQELLAKVCQGRLTLTTGTPVTTADVTAAGTIYFTPYGGDKVALYDGSAWATYTFTEKSLPLDLVSDKNYDVFIYRNSGTLTLELSAAWSSDAARTDVLATQNGVLVKSSATTRRYLGTIRASATNQTEDSATKRYVWNAYNRVTRMLSLMVSADSWSYSTATWRQANGSTANQLDIVAGLSEDAISLSVDVISQNSAVTNARYISIGEDSTTTKHARATTPLLAINNSSAFLPMHAALITIPTAGRHFYAWLERGDGSSTSNFYGDNGDVLLQSGMAGTWKA